MSDRLCLTDDRMVPCPVAGMAQRLITAERVRGQRDNAMAEVERLTAEAAEYNRGLAGLTSVVEATTEQTNRLLARARASDAEVERLRLMILYALAGPDEDLPEALGGRAVEGTKKVLRDALEVPE